MFFSHVFRNFSQTFPDPPATVAPRPKKTFGNDAIIIALRQHQNPLSVTELAQAMGSSVGEASKRVAAAKRFLKITKAGRRKMVSLRDLDRKELLQLMATISPGAYWTSPPA